MELRGYKPRDCKELAQLFYDTVHSVCAQDYSPAQLNAWADGQVDEAAWNASFLAHDTVVAVENKRIIGFADMAEDGYLDRLYVHKNFQRRGVASVLCDMLEWRSQAEVLTTQASITAQPFFESRGYAVVREQQVERQGVMLTNFVMELRR